MFDIKTRAEARGDGSIHYFTGKLCPLNHVSLRYTKSGHCVECDRIRSYETKQKPHVKQKVLEYGRRYMRNVRASDEYRQKTSTEDWKRQERLRDERRRQNPEYHEAQAKRSHRRRSNLEFLNKEALQRKVYLSTEEGRTARAMTVRKYKQNNKHRAASYQAYRRSYKQKATPIWLSDTDLQLICNIYKHCAESSSKSNVKFHVDHIVPLKSDFVCGLHVPWNLRVISAFENLSKNNRSWPDMP